MKNEIVKGLVSTIIPVYNRPLLLVRAANSVLQQTHRPIEIIIIDDGSTDETVSVADELAKKHPKEIRVIYQKNSGPGSAREAGRLVARGEFIQYLDSDDILLPDKFRLQVEGLKKNPECGISYGKLRHHHLPPDVPWKQTGEKLEYMFPAFLKEHCWSFPSPLYRREILDSAGPWTSLRQEEDWEYDCRIALLGVKLHYCDFFVGEKRSDNANSLSSRWSIDPEYMKDRVVAHELIFHHATKAEIGPDSIEMQHFSRELFFIARQCGDLGLSYESRKMFNLSCIAAGEKRSKKFDFRIYSIVSSIIGWKKTGKLACKLDNFRK
jgi:glycosyltransferase involved in cell wall biosynthesis